VDQPNVNLNRRVVRRHPWANMPKDAGNRLFANFCLAQPRCHGVAQVMDLNPLRTYQKSTCPDR
jgi:hypothetical protein